MSKEMVSQDELYKYLQAHDVKLVRLAELMEVDPDVVTSCFSHRKDRHGVPRVFSPSSVMLLNESLPRLAKELCQCMLVFGSPQTFTNKNGKTYDPGLIEPLKKIGTYLNITGVLTRVCGWSKTKKASVFGRRSTSLYGNISEDDAIAINHELLSIAGELGRCEVVAS